MSKLEQLRALRETVRALETKTVPTADKVFDVHAGKVAGELVGAVASAKPQARADEGSTRVKVGRPRIGHKTKTLEYTKPWLAEGMSRATWYRRQKEKRDARP
jgi:hypothetical protein